MPICALLLVYAVYAMTRVALILWYHQRRRRTSQKRTTARERLLLQQQQQTNNNNNKNGSGSKEELGFYLLTLILTWIAYAFLVARVQAAYLRLDYYDFDPYAILELSNENKNENENEQLSLETLQAAFRAKIQAASSDSSNTDVLLLEQIKWAYQALADERGKLSYQRFGHPLGPLEVPAFSLTLPSWLTLQSSSSTTKEATSPTAWHMVLAVYVVSGLAAAVWAARTWWRQRQFQKAATKNNTEGDVSDLLDATNSVSGTDLQFLAAHLTPTSQYWDVLLSICAAPDTVAWALADLQRAQKIREQRLEQDRLEQEESGKKKPKQDDDDAVDFDALVNEGGWDDDDDDDDGNDEKDKDGKKKSSDSTKSDKPMLEGIDEGVLGQQWVEKTLAANKAWPPPPIALWKKQSFEYQGETVKHYLDHPGLRRVLCMTMGRLNSAMLNSHPELLEAGSKRMIDQTYFRSSMEFRQRAGLLLEGALRLGMTLRSFRFVESTIETVALFKIGCTESEESKKWFQNSMKRQYDCLPSLKIHSSAVLTPDEKEIATGDQAQFQLQVERLHAENFLRSKINICKKQGIPPQVALQNYREGWWLLLRHQRLDGPTAAEPIDRNMGMIKSLEMSESQVDLFEKEKPEYRLLVGSPAIVSNVAQKTGKFSIGFQAPKVPGKYRFILAIKSQDFLGADQEVRVDVTIVDAASVQRTPKAKEEAKKED